MSIASSGLIKVIHRYSKTRLLSTGAICDYQLKLFENIWCSKIGRFLWKSSFRPFFKPRKCSTLLSSETQIAPHDTLWSCIYLYVNLVDPIDVVDMKRYRKVDKKCDFRFSKKKNDYISRAIIVVVILITDSMPPGYMLSNDITFGYVAVRFSIARLEAAGGLKEATS